MVRSCSQSTLGALKRNSQYHWLHTIQKRPYSPTEGLKSQMQYYLYTLEYNTTRSRRQTIRVNGSLTRLEIGRNVSPPKYPQGVKYLFLVYRIKSMRTDCYLSLLGLGLTTIRPEHQADWSVIRDKRKVGRTLNLAHFKDGECLSSSWSTSTATGMSRR